MKLQQQILCNRCKEKKENVVLITEGQNEYFLCKQCYFFFCIENKENHKCSVNIAEHIKAIRRRNENNN